METEVARETSGRLFEIVEDGMIFKPYEKVNGISGRWMEIEYSSDDEDGTYPLVLHYINLINKMDADGTSAWLNNGRPKHKRLEIDLGYCKAIRKSQWDVDATLIFKEPITVVFGEVGDELITREVTMIKGEFSHEWYWRKSGGRQDKYANSFSIFFDCQKFEK